LVKNSLRAELLDKFDYYEGHLVYKKRGKRQGKIAGCINQGGYVQINHKCKSMLAHRMIFLMKWGYIPKFIDHINRIRHDNNIENLREATMAQNGANCNKPLGISGRRGVFKSNVKPNPWQASIRCKNKKYHLGLFKTVDEAAMAYDQAASELFGEFAVLNFNKENYHRQA